MNKLFHCKSSTASDCGRLCSHDQLTHLMTRLALVEGSILEHLEREKIVALQELMGKLEWEPCAVMMAVGSLVRQGTIQCREYDRDVFLELSEWP